MNNMFNAWTKKISRKMFFKFVVIILLFSCKSNEEKLEEGFFKDKSDSYRLSVEGLKLAFINSNDGIGGYFDIQESLSVVCPTVEHIEVLTKFIRNHKEEIVSFKITLLVRALDEKKEVISVERLNLLLELVKDNDIVTNSRGAMDKFLNIGYSDVQLEKLSLIKNLFVFSYATGISLDGSFTANGKDVSSSVKQNISLDVLRQLALIGKLVPYFKKPLDKIMDRIINGEFKNDRDVTKEIDLYVKKECNHMRVDGY